MIDFITFLLGTGVLFIHIALVTYLVLQAHKMLVKTPSRLLKNINSFISKNALTIALIVVFVSVAGSLFYSEYAGYAPCLLCWVQRIFMYPLLLIIAWAIYAKKEITNYILGISLLGISVSIYHFTMQMIETYFPSDMEMLLPCDTVGMTPSCTSYFFLEYGYITIPLMCLTGFAAIIACMLVRKCSK